MRLYKRVLTTALIASTCSLAVIADMKPVADGSKEMEIAQTANGIFSVKHVRSADHAYKLVTMDTGLNGDIGNTSILLTGDEVGGEAGFDSAFLLSPHMETSSGTTDVLSVDGITPNANGGVEITYSTANGETQKRNLKFDAKKRILVEGKASTAQNCGDLQSTNEVYQCLITEFEKEDKTLNAVYAKAMKKSDKVAAKKLQSAEKAWLPYRNAVCAMEADDMRGGTYEKVLNIGCLVRMTKERTAAILRSN